MADEGSGQKVDPSLVAEIVRSYVAQNSIGVDQGCGPVRDGAPHAQWPRQQRAYACAGSAGAGGPEPAIGAARAGHLPRMRVPRPNAAPASPYGAWARSGGVSRPLEIVPRSRVGRAGLFGSPLGDGEGAGARPQAGPDRGAGPKAAWPQIAIGCRAVTRSRLFKERRKPPGACHFDR